MENKGVNLPRETTLRQIADHLRTLALLRGGSPEDPGDQSLPALNVPQDQTLRQIASSLQAIVAAEGAQADWRTVQRIVQQGLGPAAFPVGTQLRVTHSTLGEIVFDVAAHDYDKKTNEPDAHTMTLLSHRCVHSSMQYDAPEALYMAADGLEPGTYHFTLLAGYDVANGGGQTLQFTLTQSVPANGVIMFNWSGQAVASKISTYASNASTTAIETVDVSVGSEGANLGAADGHSQNMNYTHRFRFGSNNWRESAIRQWLNSAAAAGSVWSPQTIFDRPPTWAANTAGFMAGLPEDFLETVGECDHITKTNAAFEVDDPVNSTYITRDKFFLPSYSEVFGESENGLSDGTLLPCFSSEQDEDRMKLNASGIASQWWLRSPNTLYSYSVRSVASNGSSTSSIAYGMHGVAPACVIC